MTLAQLLSVILRLHRLSRSFTASAVASPLSPLPASPCHRSLFFRLDKARFTNLGVTTALTCLKQNSVSSGAEEAPKQAKSTRKFLKLNSKNSNKHIEISEFNKESFKGWLTENDELSLERNFVSATYQCSNQMKTRLENLSEKEEPPIERHGVNKSGLGATVGVGTVYNDRLGFPSSTFEIDVSRVRERD
ncbi:hypothetical protein DY000_02007717 [Brassica cretica]|uniref:Uncharacterized protein n=1 Tax=Brassica cretica TaxID=69181 RepID=A0ABQ7BZJ5_BRACR|nr:hypothetical protein DY000_02007717 [Brassica cretica]